MKLLAGAALALALAVPATAATASSGVVARVVAKQGDLRGCLRAPCYRPVAGVTVTFVRGTETLRGTSDRLGRFRLQLAPGAWTVRAPRMRSAGLATRLVRVPEGRVMPLTIVVARAALR